MQFVFWIIILWLFESYIDHSICYYTRAVLHYYHQYSELMSEKLPAWLTDNCFSLL